MRLRQQTDTISEKRLRTTVPILKRYSLLVIIGTLWRIAEGIAQREVVLLETPHSSAPHRRENTTQRMSGLGELAQWSSRILV